MVPSIVGHGTRQSSLSHDQHLVIPTSRIVHRDQVGHQTLDIIFVWTAITGP